MSEEEKDESLENIAKLLKEKYPGLVDELARQQTKKDEPPTEEPIPEPEVFEVKPAPQEEVRQSPPEPEPEPEPEDEIKVTTKEEKVEEKKPEYPTDLPKYFTVDKFADEVEERVLHRAAGEWLLGLGKNKSHSAMITYAGSHRVITKQLMLMKRGINPDMGNWVPWQGEMTFFRGQEKVPGIKDPIFIRTCLHSSNYKVRFVEDEPMNVKEEKRKVLARQTQHILQLPERIRYSQIKVGVRTPLNPGEAALFLEQLETDTDFQKEKFGFITDYLHELKLKDEQEGVNE